VLNSDHVDLRNNVVYNWRDNATHFDNINTTESTIPYPHHLNVAGNYYKQGPNWSASPGEPIEVISQYVFNIQNNLYEYRNGTKTKVQSDLTNGTWKTYAPDYPAVLTSSPETAFDQVLNTAGSWPRDTLDKRNIREARTGTGGWCYSANSALLPSGMDFTKKAETDADNDGIPDTWAKVRLIPSNDPSGDADNDGYTNIEEYLQYRASVLLGTFTTGTAGPVHGANGPNTSVRTVTVALDGMPGVSFSLPVNSNTGKASLKILSASGKVAAKFSLRTTGSNAVLNKKVALQPGLYTAVLEGANYSARNRFVINE